MISAKQKHHQVWLLRQLVASICNQSGFTLLEALIAVLVVGILLTGIAPMVALSTAARVQARRVDQAVQVARSYADAVRSGAISTALFPISNTTSSYTFEGIAAPTAPPNQALMPGTLIDANNNGFSFSDPQDLVIQPIRNRQGSSANDLQREGFVLGIRVYRATAFTSSGLAPDLTTLKSGALPGGGDDPVCSTRNRVFTSTYGSRVCPLVIMRVDIIPSATRTIQDLNNRL
jgi:prepilin-type N-terminal cleavage/methylation domain-containing protein